MSILYKDLDVWQMAMSLAEQCYAQTAVFPRHEQFGLSNQIRRAAVSIPANIAEGSCRHNDKVYANHVAIALGSQAELETLIELSRRLGYLHGSNADLLDAQCSRVGQLLNGLFRSMK